MKKIKFVYFYFVILLFVVLGYFINSPLRKIGIYNKLDQYFGVTLFPTLLFFIIYGLIFLKENSTKRIVAEIKLYMIFISLFLFLSTLIIYFSGLDFSSIEGIKNISLDQNYFKNLIDNCIYRYKIGYFPTYLLYSILTLKYKFFNIFIALILIQVILIFLVVYSPIKNYFRDKIRQYRDKKRIEEEEKLLQEQIRIKEYLEKKQTIKRMKFKENTERIKEEKVEVFKKTTKLTKFVDLENDKE